MVDFLMLMKQIIDQFKLACINFLGSLVYLICISGRVSVCIARRERYYPSLYLYPKAALHAVVFCFEEWKAPTQSQAHETLHPMYQEWQRISSSSGAASDHRRR